MNFKFFKKMELIFLISIMALSFWLMLIHLDKLDYEVDEYGDIKISESLIKQFPLGNNDDPSQTRLSMIVSAPLFLFFKASISLARYVAIFFGVMTLLITYLLAEEFFGGITALISTLILGINILFLEMSRLAFTEGDMPYVFFFILSIYLFTKSLKKNSIFLLYLSGISSGLCIASKFFGIFLILILVIIFFFVYYKKKFKLEKNFSNFEKITIILSGLIFLFLIFEIFYIFINIKKDFIDQIISAYINTELNLNPAAKVQLNQIFDRLDLLMGIIVILFIIITIIVYLFLFKKFKRKDKIDIKNIFIWILLSLIFFFVGSYPHLARPFMIASLVGSFLVFGEPSNIFQNIIYGWIYYPVSILVRFTFPLAIIFFVSYIYMLLKRNKEFFEKCLLIVVPFYMFIITTLHWRHVHYLLPVIPLIAIISGKGICDFIKIIQKNRLLLVIFLLILLAFLVFTITEAVITAPYYDIYGSNFVPESFVGATNIVTLDPCNGAIEGVEWLNKNIKKNSTFLGFSLCREIIEKNSKGINFKWESENLEPEFYKKYEYVLMSFEFIPKLFDMPFKKEKYEKEKAIRAEVEKYCTPEHKVLRNNLNVIIIYKCIK